MVINQHNGAGGDSAHFGNGKLDAMCVFVLGIVSVYINHGSFFDHKIINLIM